MAKVNLVNISLDSIGELLKDIREVITGRADPEKLKELDVKLAELENQLNLAQVEVNKIEARSPNWFVAGWRPFVGWVSGFALAYSFVLRPLLTWVSKMIGGPDFPAIDDQVLMSIVLAMLGMAGLRTFEKKNRVQALH